MVTYPALDLNIFYSFKTSAFTTELSRYPATYRAHATYYDTRGHIGESHRDKMIVFPTTEWEGLILYIQRYNRERKLCELITMSEQLRICWTNMVGDLVFWHGAIALIPASLGE